MRIDFISHRPSRNKTRPIKFLTATFLFTSFILLSLFVNITQQQQQLQEHTDSNSKTHSSKPIEEVPDDQLDPEDLVDYERENANVTTITKASTTTQSNVIDDLDPRKETNETFNDTRTGIKNVQNRTEIIDEDLIASEQTKEKYQTTTTVKPEENNEQTYDYENKEATDKETETDESDVIVPKINSDNLNFVDLTTYTYQTLKVNKPLEMNTKADISYYLIRAVDESYQVEMHIDSKSPIEFRTDIKSCAISYNDTNSQCVKSYVEIFKPNAILKINKALLPHSIDIKFRLVISGCNMESRVRDIEILDHIPFIYHNSDQDCIYRIKNKESFKSMVSVSVMKFPQTHLAVCKASVQILNSNSNDTNLDKAQLQASFESIDSLMPFAQGVFVSQKYTLVKLSNCFENTEPIEVKISLLKKISFREELSEEGDWSYLVNSYTITSKKMGDSTLLFELINRDRRNTIQAKLNDYKFETKKEDCSQLISNSSLITLYGIGGSPREMLVKQFWPCNYQLTDAIVEFKDFEKIYLQFYREPYHIRSNKKVDEFQLEFFLKPVKKYYKKIIGRSSSLSSQELESTDFRNQYLDFEIEAPIGSRIILNLTKFDNGVKESMACESNLKGKCVPKCRDFVIIKVNRTLSRNGLLIENAPNPKYCNSITNQVLVSSYSNRLLLTFSFDSIESLKNAVISPPSFEFSYTSEPICNNEYKKPKKDLISYNSLQSIDSEGARESLECKNSIVLNKFHRIVLYKINWPSSKYIRSYQNIYDQEEESSNSFVNGKLMCKNSDSLVISNNFKKYPYGKNTKESLSIASNDAFNTFCAENPFNTFISDKSHLYLSYNRANKSGGGSVKPLAFDIGYFSYRYLYSDHSNNINIDFSDLIPASINDKTKISHLEFKIKLNNMKNYIMPVISDCNTQLESGQVVIRTNQHTTPFNMMCGNKTYTLMSSMETELTFEFSNIYLSELRDKGIKFKVNYRALPRILTQKFGSFESNNFKHNYVSLVRENVEYEWIIDLDTNDFIRLKIESLENPENIIDLSIHDGYKNIQYYDQNELIDAFKTQSSQLSYLFSTNRIRIKFVHLKDSKTKWNKYPYVRFSYVAEDKLISLKSNGKKDGIILFDKSSTKDKLEWVVMAPKEHLVLMYVISYSTSDRSNGQLKFSALNQGYSDNGTYFLDLNKYKQNDITRSTDIVVSKDNVMRVEYSPGEIHDSFKIAYSFAKKIQKNPSGIIKQYTNEFVRPQIYVPKLTDQTWVIKAPYGKQIQIFTRFIDLLGDEPCSKAVVNFFESNGTMVASKCGHLDIEPSNYDFEKASLIVSDSNELTVRFMTQNTDEAVYSVKSGMDNDIDLYRGFVYYYTFVEHSGDCFFQIRRNLSCRYTNMGNGKSVWHVDEDMENKKISDKEEMNFDQLFCTNCYLTASIPIQIESEIDKDLSKRPIIVSPTISKTKRYLRFSHKLTSNAQLKVNIIYEREYNKSMIDHSYLLKVFKPEKSIHKIKSKNMNGWKTVSVKIANQIFHNFRLMFILEKLEDDSAAKSMQIPTASIDNIQLFEQETDCSWSFDSTCEQIDLTAEQQNEKKLSTSCQRYATPCDVNKCANGALCINKDGDISDLVVKTSEGSDDYVCSCKYGFTGKYCETVVDPCSSSELNKCSKNSQCIAISHTDYTCKCDVNHYGKYCELKYTPCKNTTLVENPCHQLEDQGVCIDMGTKESPNNFACACSPMYTGKNCEQKLIDSCQNSKCNVEDKNATCIELNDRFICKCSLGFEGLSCKNIDDCASSPCMNNGVCIDGINSFECKCPSSHTGKYCEKLKACEMCNKDGTLYCDKEKSKCVCKTTHTGNSCDQILDPCMDNPCVNGKCMSNKIDQFQCFCDEGYKGRKCDIKETICDRGHCLNGATCTPIVDSNDKIEYNCKCADGYEGENCEKIKNNCEANPCKNGGTCFNSVNNFTCICPDNYHGKSCEIKIDNCLANKCQHGSTCISVANSYVCKCLPGKLGRYCTEENDRCLNNMCMNGKCVPDTLENNNQITGSIDNKRKYKCECEKGFTGINCDKEVEYCQSSPCENEGTCINLIGTYRCICKSGFSGKNCQTSVNYCSLPETSCNSTNTQRCVQFKGGNKCVCQSGYTGRRCEIKINACEFYKPCRSGVCQNIGDEDYECKKCDPGFTGKNCSDIIDHCDKNPCKNNGVCYSSFQSEHNYYCACKEGYSGKNCENRISQACLLNRCQHNSQCIPTRTGYKCICDEKHDGEFCEKIKDKCKNVNCKYGYCVDGKCQCDPKILFCKKESECKNIICENGGTCIDVIESESRTVSRCLCPSGLTGTRCETSVFCSSLDLFHPCGMSLKQCKTVNQTYQCECEKNRLTTYRSYLGHGCNKTFSDYEPSLNTYLTEEKLVREKINCRFGNSKESRLFIGIAAVGILIFALLGFLIGHCAIVSYRKRYEMSNSMQSSNMNSMKSNYSLMQGDDSASKSLINNQYKTPMQPKLTEITLNKINGFSIPRPSVRL